MWNLHRINLKFCNCNIFKKKNEIFLLSLKMPACLLWQMKIHSHSQAKAWLNETRKNRTEINKKMKKKYCGNGFISTDIVILTTYSEE